MCGRYALGVRLAYMRQQLEDMGMPVDEAPEDEDVRETYNFAPGNFGAVYRADVPDERHGQHKAPVEEQNEEHQAPKKDQDSNDQPNDGRTKFKIQSMKWGLIPFWTKRAPDYGSMMRTINCRDDSLIEDRGMWTSMKRRKRCIIVCQGFYEWLKKGPGGKEKVPHFIKRKDGDLMCFAGLWDCVQYEGSEEKLYTYTIITTSSNSYLKFLHDRMPVILDPSSDEMKKWLDPKRTTWSKELQSILKPYEGDLECYPVSKEVGKVGNNSPEFLVPVNSKENKQNIANFFSNATKKEEKSTSPADVPPKIETVSPGTALKDEGDEKKVEHGVKREHPEDMEDESKKLKTDQGSFSRLPPKPKTRSATHNTPTKKSTTKPPDGSQRITNFFKR
ncbi:hypothetical protein N7532_011808 [Penicillium argentinense]|uniref:DUF159 domain protein n=1 Tax=Penicillium argentinense TaxID=1131581 RepID=A0A9W9EJA1_9EURO|nr:uncharacterized protein N7532_011808 [Penicillium argentinense]KAJ5082765.1 hypothetical protein N7532_011808 [Penicillium argentinense]